MAKAQFTEVKAHAPKDSRYEENSKARRTQYYAHDTKR